MITRTSRCAAALVTAGAGTSLCLMAAAATPAYAGNGPVAVDTGSGWTTGSAAPLFDTHDITPGWQATATIRVRNNSDGQASLALRTTNVINDENGCTASERLVDSTCTGSNAGELGSVLVLSVYPQPSGDDGPSNDGGHPAPVVTGTVDDLEHGQALTSDLAAGAVSAYRIVAELPTTVGNQTQSDRLGFDLALTLQGRAGASTVAVKGLKITRPPGLLSRLFGLPMTGAPTRTIAATALGLLLAGGALLRRTRTGPRTGRWGLPG